MFVTNAESMDSGLKSVLEINPFTNRIKELSNNQSSIKDNLASNFRTIEQYKIEVINLYAKNSIYKQRVAINEAELKHITKLASDTSSEFTCNYLDTDKMQKFFNDNGLKFIALVIKNNGSEAALSYVRPSKYIGGLPSQPYIVNLTYSMREGVLVFKRPYVIGCITSDAEYTHPHVSDSSVCLGNYFDIMNDNDYSLLLNGYQEQVILLENLLSTFNPDSPYMAIDRIIAGLSKRIRFDSDRSHSISNYNTYTFRNSDMVGNATEFQAHKIITEDLFRDYFAMLGNISAGLVIEDIICYLQVLSPDGRQEDYDFMCEYQSRLSNLLPSISLSDVDDYKSYDDDDESILDEDSFDDLKNAWISELRKAIKPDSEISLSFNFPEIAQYFTTEVDNVSN